MPRPIAGLHRAGQPGRPMLARRRAAAYAPAPVPPGTALPSRGGRTARWKGGRTGGRAVVRSLFEVSDTAPCWVRVQFVREEGGAYRHRIGGSEDVAALLTDLLAGEPRELPGAVPGRQAPGQRGSPRPHRGGCHCPARPRAVFQVALLTNAAAEVLAHNHPSGGTVVPDQGAAAVGGNAFLRMEPDDPGRASFDRFWCFWGRALDGM